MRTAEILREIERLPMQKRIYVIEKTIHSIRLQSDQKIMGMAADALYDDYKTDTELTAFTQLDFETFYEAR